MEIDGIVECGDDGWDSYRIVLVGLIEFQGSILCCFSGFW